MTCLAVALSVVACVAGAQSQTFVAESGTPEERPGLIRAGSWYFTPYLHIGSLGVDTNVFYTPTNSQADFIASGGPGLEIVRPLDAKANSRIRLDGGLDYLYFARTESQRRLNGYGSALLELHGVKTDLVVGEDYAQSYSRPSYQVDERVQQETEGTRALVKRRLGERFELAPYGERQRLRVESVDYLGTDLRQTTSQDRYLAGGELRMALTVKTQLVGGGEEDWYRFPYLPERDGQSTLAFGGFRTDDTALLAGHALAGMRWFKLDTGGRRDAFYADVSATWNLSPKTHLGMAYSRDLQYSAFSTTGATPTNVYETALIFLDKMLARNIYLRLSGAITWLRSDGAITVIVPGQEPQTAVRDDTVHDVSAELGYQFRTRTRIGGRISYTTRVSPFETFGIHGLLAGLTVTYNPPQPKFR